MDTATLIGIIAGCLLIGSAIVLGPAPMTFINMPSVLITFGGAAAAMFIRFPLRTVSNTFVVTGKVFIDKVEPPDRLIPQIVRLAEKARRDSLLALEDAPIDDVFLKRGIQLCVDGTEPQAVRETLRIEIDAAIDRHKTGQRVLRGLGESGPAFGLIGTLIGLVQMFVGMTDPDTIGPAFAVAVLTTLYGALLANLFCLPMADKLAQRTAQEMQNKEIVIQGIMGIMAAQHPRLVEARLLAFLEPKARDQATTAARPRRAAA